MPTLTSYFLLLLDKFVSLCYNDFEQKQHPVIMLFA